jgi:hypothetical protein
MRSYFNIAVTTEEKSHLQFGKTKKNNNYIQLFEGDEPCFIPKKTALTLDLRNINRVRSALRAGKVAIDHKTFSVIMTRLGNFPQVVKFFMQEKLSLNQIESFSDKMVERLGMSRISDLYEKGKLSLDQIDNLTNDAIIRIVNDLEFYQSISENGLPKEKPKQSVLSSSLFKTELKQPTQLTADNEVKKSYNPGKIAGKD